MSETNDRTMSGSTANAGRPVQAWWVRPDPQKEPLKRLRAVAYYRHSAEIGQENSVEIQQDNVSAFAEKHSIKVIREFADRGKSGLNAEGRPAFNEMMDLVRSSQEFELILVLNVSRWGRFQDTDLSAHYESLCKQHGKQVIYTQIGFGRAEDRLVTQLRKSIDRYQSAEYSRILSTNVFEGAAKVAHQGYRPGGPPPYGFHRLMLDEKKRPDRILQPGQRKAIQNGRVVLVPGDATQVGVDGVFSLNFAMAVAQSEDRSIQHLLMDAFDNGLVTVNSLPRVRKVIEDRLARGKALNSSKPIAPYTVEALKRDIGKITREKESFVREVGIRENRLTRILVTLQQLRSDEVLLKRLQAAGLAERPQLKGDYGL